MCCVLLANTVIAKIDKPPNNMTALVTKHQLAKLLKRNRLSAAVRKATPAAVLIVNGRELPLFPLPSTNISTENN